MPRSKKKDYCFEDLFLEMKHELVKHFSIHGANHPTPLPSTVAIRNNVNMCFVDSMAESMQPMPEVSALQS